MYGKGSELNMQARHAMLLAAILTVSELPVALHLYRQVGNEPRVLVYFCHSDTLVRIAHKHAC